MRPGKVLDPATGRPRVVPVRQDDGVLTFAYETRRQGGMAVLVDVPPEAMGGARADDDADLDAEVEKATRGVSRWLANAPEPEPGVSAAELEEMAARAETAEARVEAADEQLSEKEVENAALAERLAEAERRLAEAEQQKPASRAPARPRSGGGQTKAAA